MRFARMPGHRFLRRAINRVARPFGIVPFGAPAKSSPRKIDGPRDTVFEKIYQRNEWGSQESGSGPGSELARTAEYRRALLSFLTHFEIQSLFDAPCGDLNWMRAVLAERPINYIGGDISETAVAVARERCPSLDIRRFDICTDAFPSADVWHCRDALFHLAFEDIWLALANSARSNIKYALLTTHRPRVLKNVDIETGGWRYLDLHRPPFNLPQADDYLRDFLPGQLPRWVGVWRIETIREISSRRAAA